MSSKHVSIPISRDDSSIPAVSIPSLTVVAKPRTKIVLFPESNVDDKLAEQFDNLEIDEDRRVYTASGHLLGNLSPDGLTLLALDGTILGVGEEIHNKRKAKAEFLRDDSWLDNPDMTDKPEDAIAQYLRIPTIQDELKQSGGIISLENYTNVQKNKKKQKEAKSILGALRGLDGVESSVREPEEGIYPHGFDVQKFERERQAVEYFDYTPTVFSRKHILPPDQVPADQLVVDVKPMVDVFNMQIEGHKFTFLWIDGLEKLLPSNVRSSLDKYLRHMPNLEVLGLRKAGIVELPHLKLRHLLLLDLSRNKISNYNAVGMMTTYSRKLRSLNLLLNPIMKIGLWTKGIPHISNEFWKVVMNLSQLEILNERTILNIDRSHAMEIYAVKSQKKRVPICIWNIALNSLLSRSGMKIWRPELIERLEISNEGVRVFHIGMMKNLKHLNLSRNLISSIQGTGIEQCSLLQYLNLSENKIRHIKHEGNPLKPLSYLTLLKSLDLRRNLLKDYHSSVIFLTLHLKGSNRTPGLQVLDGKQVTIEDKIRAIHAYQTLENYDADRERWKYNLISNFGNLQLRCIDNFFARVKQLKLAKRQLKEVYLNDFANLQVLDVSENYLTDLTGLECCPSLVYLNASGNRHLNSGKVLKILKDTPFTKLQYVNLLTDPKKADHKQYQFILESLLIVNRCLEFINEQEISIEDRVQIYGKSIKGVSLPKYRLNLALAVSATEKISSFYPDDVEIGIQYNPFEVKELLELSHLSLSDSTVDFSVFRNLEKLNLANNNIKNLMGIGIEDLTSLKWLDIRNNKIANSASEIGGLIDKLEKLEVLVLRGNPCQRNKKDRIKILKSITRVKNLECGFRVLDTEITVAERIEAWSARGEIDKESKEQLKFMAAIRIRSPADMRPETVLGLDLSKLQLTMVDLSAYVNLKKLNLSQNKLKSLQKSGISCLKDLVVLDIRKNQLSSIDDLVQSLSKLKCLEYIGISGNLFSSTSRQLLLKKLPICRSIDCRLMYIDDSAVSIGEILSCISDEFTGGKSVEKESKFRWDLSIRRHLTIKQIRNPNEISKISLSNCTLTYVQFSWLPSLEVVNISNNNITNSYFEASGIETLINLRVLDISYNDLTSLECIASKLSNLPFFESIYIVGNKCFMEDSRRSRVSLLKNWDGIDSPAFSLKSINGKQIIVDERMEAVSSALSERDAQRIRIEHILNEMTEDPLTLSELNLSNMQLTYIDGVQRCQNLTSLNLSENNIRVLSQQYLHELPMLTKLTISNNLIESVEDIVKALSLCNHLKEVNMLNSTIDKNETDNVSNYISSVGYRLRGLEKIDGKPNPSSFTPIQKDAQEWLLGMTNVGANGLVHVDISNLNLPAKSFFMILCALKEVGSVVTLRANGNLWNKGKFRLRSYRQYVIHALGNELVELDGTPVLDDERLNSLELVDREEHKGIKLIKRGWLANKEEAALMLENILASRDEKAKKKEEKNEQLGPEGDEFHDEPMEFAQGSAMRGGSSGSIEGTILTKVEIIINFFQVYALILLLDLSIPWPRLFIDFSSWIRFFSIDIDAFFRLDLAYQQEINFLVMVTLPMFFALVYWGTNRASIQKWRQKFVENWSSNRRKITALYVLTMIIIVILAFALYPQSFQNIKEKKPPLPETFGFLFVVGVVNSLIFFIYYYVANSFRKKNLYEDDQSFQKWWFKRLYFLRRASLFMLTVLFMPVARLILLQFSCQESSEGSGFYLEIYPDRLCPNEKIYPIQYVAIVFGILYILGIPFLFRWLIYIAVKMVDTHGYSDEKTLYESMLNRRRKNENEWKKSPEYKKLEKDASDHLKKYYYNEVKNNPMAQSYLFAAYKRRFRYFKVFQMLQKLLIVMFSFFIPTTIRVGSIGSLKLICTNSVVLVFAIVSLIFRPFNQPWEDRMDTTSQITNLVNLLIALLLQAGVLTDVAGSAILLLVNISIIIFFVSVLASGLFSKFFRKILRKIESHRKIQLNSAQIAVEQDIELGLREDLIAMEKQKMIAQEAAEKRLGSTMRRSTVVSVDPSKNHASFNAGSSNRSSIAGSEASEIVAEENL